uniref:DinB domain protein n=1 Tax=uncultured marine crenarchaeote E37-7F TaxID=907717 RepID=G9BAR6_9ARCH|nr:DinB domain protein [uncultured marine crenarchaeote E37-7F]
MINFRGKCEKMVDIMKFLEYNEEVRHRYFNTLVGLSWEEMVKNREASFHSLRNIFVHTLNAINYWLDFLQNEKQYVRRQFIEYKNIEDVRRYMEHVEARLQKYVTSLTQEDLKRVYTTINDLGNSVKICVEDVLIHLVEEEIHHRGELIALLWQIGVKPPIMGWKNL